MGILTARIDNRLIHGQIGAAWCKALNIDIIVVSCDEVVNDPIKEELMDMAAPIDIGTRYWTVEETAEKLDALSDSRVLLITRTPQDLLAVVQQGVRIKKATVGIMQMSEGKTQYSEAVAVDESDMNAFRALKEEGVDVVIQRVPQDEPMELNF